MVHVVLVLVIVLQVVAVVLVTDFLSGLFHWWEDTYGHPFWPIVGTHVTRPNILHHYAPRAILAKSWIVSSRTLLAIGVVIALLAWLAGILTWTLVLGLCLAVNMNQVHKWSHQRPRDNPPLVRRLQQLGVLQSPAHHRAHHIHERNTNYCILTNFVNPLLERMHCWAAAEWVLARVFGVHRRGDAQRAALVLAREPEFFGEHLPFVQRRVAMELAREAAAIGA
ncbi:fatty acid desaturase CarF family protein [Gemmatimonas sp.]|uniref:fatty acid desaturase CarF family protein n=1 Tax=Gemmatimonas sp. TaxID=1962908 RepID=UPI00286B0AB7|nr:fatty acid desaturase CarF family protein [Gemmatimonas sp.]